MSSIFGCLRSAMLQGKSNAMQSRWHQLFPPTCNLIFHGGHPNQDSAAFDGLTEEAARAAVNTLQL
jgi:hypothetical protein